MSSKHQLHLFAFDVTNPPMPKHPVYGFMMPPSWQKIISPWVFEGDHKKAIAFKRLRNDLMQLYPGLLYTRFDEPALHGHTPTIIADQPIPVDVLARHFTRHFHMQQKSESFDVSDTDWTPRSLGPRSSTLIRRFIIGCRHIFPDTSQINPALSKE